MFSDFLRLFIAESSILFFMESGVTEEEAKKAAWDHIKSPEFQAALDDFAEFFAKAYSCTRQELENSDEITAALREVLQNPGKYLQNMPKDCLLSGKGAQITPGQVSELAYPLDKVNSKLFGAIMPGEMAALKAESNADSLKGKQADIMVMIDFSEAEAAGFRLSRELSSHDKRVFMAAAALKMRGCDVITPTQIYKAMGGERQPAPNQIEKIMDSIEVMRRCIVTIDNESEAELYKYDKVQDSFYLLNATVSKGFVNGIEVKTAITVNEFPKMMQFAMNRRQVGAVPIAALQSPISKTGKTLTLENYLIERILRMKNGGRKSERVILIDTICKSCGIKSGRGCPEKRRALDKIKTLLEHYSSSGFIKGYKIGGDRIEVKL